MLFYRLILCAFLLLIIVFLPNCAPVFSELQSAKLVGKNKSEVTASYSSVSFSNEGESEAIQDQGGVQVAYGLSDNIDLRTRYEYVKVDIHPSLPAKSVHVLGLGPKFNLVRDQLAFNLPVGVGFGKDVSSEIWELQPSLIYTITLGNSFEFNPSGKAVIPLSGGGDDILYAINLGSALSTDLTKWAVRPEIGFLYNPQDDGHFTHFSIGLTIYP